LIVFSVYKYYIYLDFADESKKDVWVKSGPLSEFFDGVIDNLPSGVPGRV